MLQPRKYDLLARLLDLAREEDLVQDRIHLSPTSALPSSNLFFIYSYLIEIEHQIQLTNIPEKLIQHLDKKMYRLQIRQLIIIGVHARAEEEPCVAPVYHFGAAPEFDEVGLVLLVARSDEAVDFAFEADFLVVGVGVVPFC